MRAESLGLLVLIGNWPVVQVVKNDRFAVERVRYRRQCDSNLIVVERDLFRAVFAVRM